YLYLVVACGLGFCSEIDKTPVVENRKSIADNRCFNGLLDDVVRQQYVGVRFFLGEDIQEIFTVWRSNFPQKSHVVCVALKDLVGAVLQVISVGEDQSLVVRQQDGCVV